MYPTNNPSNTFVFASFSREATADIILDINGQKMTISEYHEKKNIKLTYPHFPAVIAEKNGKGPKRFYPIELLKVLANQRVPLAKMPKVLLNQLHKENVVKPHVRYGNIVDALEKLNLTDDDNDVMDKFGVSVDPESNTVNILMLSNG